MLVRDLMVPTVLTVSPNAPVSDADKAMRETSDAAAVVLEGQNIVGILTEKDPADAPNDSTVQDVMDKGPAVIAPGAPLTEAARR